MARLRSDPLIIGVGGHVLALNADTGDELWRTKLKSSSYVTISQIGKYIYAGAAGEVYCLEARTGSVMWINKLKGLGLGLVSFGGSDAAAAALEAQRAAAAASG